MRMLSNTIGSAEQLLALSHAELAGHIVDAIRKQRNAREQYHRQDVRFSADEDGRVVLAITEAWEWMRREMIVVPTTPPEGHWCTLSRLGLEMVQGKTWAAVASHRLIATELIHEAIREETSTLFLRGRYDSAIFEAMKTLEITVRAASRAPDSLVGWKLMRYAFDPTKGPLRDPEREDSERESEANLFAGVMGAYRNAVGHRNTTIGADECAQVIVTASLLLRIVDARTARGIAAPALGRP